MLINLVITTCRQIYQEEYKENEKESVIYILHVFPHGVNCKRNFLLVAKYVVK